MIMDPTKENKELLFHQTYLKALLDNKNNTAKWKEYREKYEEVIKNLNFYNEKSRHSVCIPIGSKAFVKGSLVHTNDVWVTLGSGWFLKTGSKSAVEICKRRIKVANELLEKWEKERKLIESMKEHSINKDVFGGDDTKEIIEPYDETKEDKWREEHKEKQRKYRQQLKEVKEKTGSAVLRGEKDLWEHLEALELQEELEDELNRLGCSDTSSNEEYESDSDGAISNEDKVGDETINPAIISETRTEELKTQEENHVAKKKVSFIESVDILENEKINEKPPNKNIPEAILDRVVEKVLEANSDAIEDNPKRPLSKFKVNRLSK